MGRFNMLINAQSEPLYDTCINQACERPDCGKRMFAIRNDINDDTEDFIPNRLNPNFG